MHPKLLRFRHRLFRYRFVEQKIAKELAGRPGPHRLLDVGCGDGENLLRFDGREWLRLGLEISWLRLRAARRAGLDVFQASGTRLPAASGAFEYVYVAHVLHHVADYEQLLAEIARCLAPGGRCFVVETVTDNPLLRLGRRLRPSWRGDQVEASWRFAELVVILQNAGFEIEHSGRYNHLFFLWEMGPLAFWPLEIFTPIFIYLDLFLAGLFKRLGRHYSAHCFFVLRRNERTG
jgi:ubiquinone/menaquinone biosynthesis C-methylase UbiE